jgi:hypothetical protein
VDISDVGRPDTGTAHAQLSTYRSRVEVTGFFDGLEAWPTTPAGVTGFYTIYPNPDQLLAGQLDERLLALIGSAPPQGGVLTAYAEADGDVGNGGQFAPLGLTKEKLLQVHAYLQALCRGSPVKYGAVVCGTGLDQVLFCPPGLDFYALDWYDNWNPPLIRGLNAWRENLVQHVQESPVLAIAETNSNVPAQRPSWFATVYGWLAGYSAENAGGRWATGATGAPTPASAACPARGCRTTPLRSPRSPGSPPIARGPRKENRVAGRHRRQRLRTADRKPGLVVRAEGEHFRCLDARSDRVNLV